MKAQGLPGSRGVMAEEVFTSVPLGALELEELRSTANALYLDQTEKRRLERDRRSDRRWVGARAGG